MPADRQVARAPEHAGRRLPWRFAATTLLSRIGLRPHSAFGRASRHRDASDHDEESARRCIGAAWGDQGRPRPGKGVEPPAPESDRKVGRDRAGGVHVRGRAPRCRPARSSRPLVGWIGRPKSPTEPTAGQAAIEEVRCERAPLVESRSPLSDRPRDPLARRRSRRSMASRVHVAAGHEAARTLICGRGMQRPRTAEAPAGASLAPRRHSA
jgi:hypothetical protein